MRLAIIIMKYILIAVLVSLLGWTVVDNFIVEVSLWNYLIIELLIVGLEFLYILAAREIK